MAELEPSDVLFIPNRRRLTHAMLAGPEGKEELHIFYGEKEIIFDEPEMMPFGNRLLNVERFRAEEATAWSGQAPYEWTKIRERLQALVEEQILKRFDETAPAKPVAKAPTYPPTLGRVPPGRVPETYTGVEAGRCPFTTQKTLGRPMELGNLEVVLPIHRVAHPALDQDGRQVGENNVAEKLFLDLPTERRLCSYAGSRYHAEAPINATALKHMNRRWPELLSLTEQFRTAYFARMPPRGPELLVGEVHLLGVACLSMVGYVMVRGVDPVPNGQLDPGLAAIFRLIDGVRICTTQMMRDTAGTHGCERKADAKIIYDYAERESLFIDTAGVCAGPQALIDEYLEVLLGGASAPIQVQPDLKARVGELDAAFDYGLRGSRIESLVRAYGAMQCGLHEELRKAFEKHAPAPTRLQELLQIPVDREHYRFLRTLHSLEETLEMEIRVGRWLFAKASESLPADPGGLRSLDDLWRLDEGSRALSERRLHEFLGRVAPTYAALPEPLQKELVALAVKFFALERAAVRAVQNEQQRINQSLRRPQATALTGDDVVAYERWCTPVVGRVLAEGLGLAITADACATLLSKGTDTLSLAD